MGHSARQHRPLLGPRRLEAAERIGDVIRTAVLDSDPETVRFLQQQLARHQVSLSGLPSIGQLTQGGSEEQAKPIEIKKADPNNPNQIANMSFEEAAARILSTPGDAERGKALFAAQSCSSCHTSADGQTPKGPHLVDIGKRSKPEQLVESILKPSEKLAQGYEGYNFVTADGAILSGFIVGQNASTIRIRQPNGMPTEIKKDDIDAQQKQDQSMMPADIAGNLTPEQVADLIAFLQSL